jgi:drug/metabolite transporter (DMT)-like permease
MTAQTNETKAISFGLAAVLCWSTVATAFKVALALQTIPQLLFIACLTSVLFLSVVLAFQGRLLTTLSDLRKDWPKAIVFGLLNPILYYVVLLSAYELLPAQVAQPINYTWAIVLAFMAVPFLGQKLAKTDLLALLICYSGVVIISSGAGSGNQQATVTGVVLALASTIIWASYWILNSRDQRAPTPALLQNFLCALPVTAILLWMMEPSGVWSWPGWLAGMYIGIFEMGLAFVFWLQAMKNTGNTSRISNLIFLSPFLSLILIYFVLGEVIHLYTYVGLVLILGGIGIQNWGKPQGT